MSTRHEKNGLLKEAIRLALYASLATAAVSPAAMAQQDANDVEEVVTTGSRIPRLDIESSAPVQVLDQNDISRSGAASVGELLREIPSVAGAAQTTQVNNGGDGSMRLSLRGLGSERLLVLINGRRVVPSGLGANASVDLSTIPVAIIERVEILKDGASAIYGSDAISGVVNLITKKDFDGVQISTRYGQTSRNDGTEEEFNVIAGRAFDGGSFTVHFGHVLEGEIEAADRDFSKEAVVAVNGEPFVYGSSAPPWGRYNVNGTPQTFGPEWGPLRDWNGSTDTYNFAPENYQRQPSERNHFNLFADMDLGSWGLGETKGFTEFSLTRRVSQKKLAPTPLAPLAFFGYEDATYSAANAYNPTGVDINDWRRRMVEGGNRFEDDEVTTYRFVAGIEGETDSGIGWDFSYNYGRTEAVFSFSNLYDLEKVANAVGPTQVDPVTGQLQCVNDPDNCVPLDVFGQNSITSEMLDYIRFTSNERGHSDQKVLQFNIFKDAVASLPAGDVGLAGGISYREETGSDIPDSRLSELGTRDAVTGTPRQPTNGGYDVKELYGEALIPVIENLEATIAFRYSDYNLFGSNTSGKLGLNWQVTDTVMIRGTVSDAFRAPSIAELFQGAAKSFPEVEDPCATDPNANCQADGVPSAGFTPISTQIPELVGGNSELEPEKADIQTLGLVFTPSNDLSFTVDYWKIELTDAINLLGAQFILDSCHDKGELCNLITRFTDAPNTGNPKLIDDRLTNIGGVNTSGFDIGVKYSNIDLSNDLGTLSLKSDITLLDEYVKIMPDGSEIDHTGKLIDDQDGNFPELRANISADWALNQWDISWTIRYIDSVKEEYYDYGLDDVVEGTIPSVTYHDVLVKYNFDENTTVSLGINNLTDEQPPLSFSAFNDNTDVRTYDTAGRFTYIEASIKF